MKLTQTQIKVIVGAISVIILAAIYFYYRAKKLKAEAAGQIKSDEINAQKTGAAFNGNNVPSSWNPQPVVNSIYTAMNGLGTDEESFFLALNNLNNDQLIVVHNLFNYTYGKPPCAGQLAQLNPLINCKGESGYYLRNWIEDEFSGAELSRALNIFSQVPNF